MTPSFPCSGELWMAFGLRGLVVSLFAATTVGCSAWQRYSPAERQALLQQAAQTDAQRDAEGWRINLLTLNNNYCTSGDPKLDESEEKFNDFLRLLQHIAQRPYENEHLHILDSGAGEDGDERINHRHEHLMIPRMILDVEKKSGIYWYGCIFVNEKKVTLELITHEFGHHTDPNLNYCKYLLSKSHEVRAESLATAFEYYANARFAQRYRFTIVSNIPAKDKKVYQTFDQLMDVPESVSTPIIPIIMLGSQENWTTADVWQWLRNHSTTQFRKELRKHESTYQQCYARGHAKLMEECKVQPVTAAKSKK